jgi:hypothetical protein
VLRSQLLLNNRSSIPQLKSDFQICSPKASNALAHAISWLTLHSVNPITCLSGEQLVIGMRPEEFFDPLAVLGESILESKKAF